MIKLKNILFEGNVKKSDKVDIYRDGNFIVVRPLTHSAAMKYGNDTNWCTSTSNVMHFNEHTKGKNFLIYIINRHRKPAPTERRNQKVRTFQQQYTSGDWENMPPEEKYELMDLSRIAVSIEYDTEYTTPFAKVDMWDANDFNLNTDFDYDSIDELPLPPNVKKAIDDYIKYTQQDFKAHPGANPNQLGLFNSN